MKTPENFNRYTKEISGKPASICVNSSIADSCRMEDFPYMACIRIFMKAPAENGLEAGDELDALDEIESSMLDYIENSNDIIYAGRCTCQGMRDYYIYSGDFEKHSPALEKICRGFKGYDFEMAYRPDEKWDLFNKFLVPGHDFHQ